jgi:hypothetical protein
MVASGRLRSNVLDLAWFMTLHMNDGLLDGGVRHFWGRAAV